MKTGNRGRFAVTVLPRPGVTIIELLVVITIIGLLMAMLIPAVYGARESARQSTCANNLRQFGVGMSDYASRHNGRLCTGAFDWLADGSVTETGWVADLVTKASPSARCFARRTPPSWPPPTTTSSPATIWR